MKKTIAIAALAAGLAVAGSAAAEGTFSLGYTQIGLDAAGTSIDLGAIRGTVGWNFTPNLGVEAEGAFGIKEESIGGTKFKLKSELAAYAVARVPVSERFTLFGRVGYGTSETEVTGFGSGSDESTNYGLGAEIGVTPKGAIRLDYTRFAFDGADADGFAVAYKHSF